MFTRVSGGGLTHEMMTQASLQFLSAVSQETGLLLMLATFQSFQVLWTLFSSNLQSSKEAKGLKEGTQADVGRPPQFLQFFPRLLEFTFSLGD